MAEFEAEAARPAPPPSPSASVSSLDETSSTKSESQKAPPPPLTASQQKNLEIIDGSNLSLADIDEESQSDDDNQRTLQPVQISSGIKHPLQNVFETRRKIEKGHHKQFKLKSSTSTPQLVGDLDTTESSEVSDKAPASLPERSMMGERKVSSSSSNFFQNMMPTYRSRSKEFDRLCRMQLLRLNSASDLFITDFSCSMGQHLTGRMFVTRFHIAFYSNMAGLLEKALVLKHCNIELISKANSILFIPNAISIQSGNDKFMFVNFLSRDKTFDLLQAVWLNRRNLTISSSGATMSSNVMSSTQSAAISTTVNGTTTTTTQTPTATTMTGSIESNNNNNNNPAYEDDKPEEESMTISRELFEHQQPTPIEWNWIKQCYGKNLGLTKPEQDEMDRIVESPNDNSFIELADIETANESTNEHLAQAEAEAVAAAAEESRRQSLNKSSSSPNLPFVETLNIVAKCPCGDHSGQTVIDSVIEGITVDEFYERNILASDDTTFFAQVHAKRKTTAFKYLNEWTQLDSQAQHDFISYYDTKLRVLPGVSKKFNLTEVKNRNLSYIVSVNVPLFNSVATRESQFLLHYTPGECIVAHSEAKSEGVPMSDCFVVNTTYCITASGMNRIRIRLQYSLNFVKSSFSLSMFKSQIERNSLQSVTEYVNDLLAFLQNYSNETSSRASIADIPSVEMRQESNPATETIQRELSHTVPDTPVTVVQEALSYSPFKLFTSDQGLLRAVLVILAITAIMNLLVVTKLWRMEHRLAAMYELIAVEVNTQSTPTTSSRVEL